MSLMPKHLPNSAALLKRKAQKYSKKPPLRQLCFFVSLTIILLSGCQEQPKPNPTAAPTAAPTAVPTATPTSAPTAVPVATTAPVSVPVKTTTKAPVKATTISPVAAPSDVPTEVQERCGLFGLGIFCPRRGSDDCSFWERFFNLGDCE